MAMETVYKVNENGKYYDSCGQRIQNKITVKGEQHYKMVRFVDPIDLNAKVQYLPQAIQVEAISLEELQEIQRKEKEFPSIRFAY
jgi:hypothetical protein